MNTTNSYTLSHIIKSIKYKAGWDFATHRYGGTYAPLMFIVHARVEDSTTGKPTLVSHSFTIPPIFEQRAIEPEQLLRWLFDRIVDVERHEAGEFFTINECRPFYPEHGPNSNPYANKFDPSCVNPNVTNRPLASITVALDPLTIHPSTFTDVSAGMNG